MRSAFNLIRKWCWKWRAVPPWHVSVRIVGAVSEDCGEILNPSLRLSEGSFQFKVPDQCRVLPSEGTVEIQVPTHTQIDVHTEVENYE